MDDEFNLNRFIAAQQGLIDRVRAELSAGRKQSHWMWFVFPQIRGLGHSSTTERYAIGSLREARAYLEHPVLGARLRECTQLVLDIEAGTAETIFGYPDYLKFRSCMTLFDTVDAGSPSLFDLALKRYYNGEADLETRRLATE